MSPVLDCFEVSGPVLTPHGPSTLRNPESDSSNDADLAPSSHDPSCDVILMDHVFASSYGQPFVGQYRAPTFDI